MQGMRLRVIVLAVLLALAAAAAPAHAQTEPKPFGTLECTAQEGVRLCSGRVPTFDGVPIDLNVTLPGTSGGANFPLIMLAHGWGGRKYPLKRSEERRVGK